LRVSPASFRPAIAELRRRVTRQTEGEKGGGGGTMEGRADALTLRASVKRLYTHVCRHGATFVLLPVAAAAAVSACAMERRAKEARFFLPPSHRKKKHVRTRPYYYACPQSEIATLALPDSLAPRSCSWRACTRTASSASSGRSPARPTLPSTWCGVAARACVD
jgi:hypothetical protein